MSAANVEIVRDALGAWGRSEVEGFDEFEMRPEEVIDATDERVVLRVHQRAVGTQSRVPIEADFWFVHTLRDGKITRMDIYGDESGALQAFGLAG